MDYFRKIKSLNRKKSDPYKFIYTGLPTDVKAEIQLFEYENNTIVEKKDLTVSDIGILTEGDNKKWLNIYGLSDTEQIVSICQKQNIDNLVIQDILDLNQRPKVQEYDNYCFLTLKTTVPTLEEMTVEQISFVFNQNYIISFQEKKADYFEHLRIRIREKKGLIRERGADFLLYTMLESILDNYFKTLNNINEEIERLNLDNINQNPSPSVLEEIEKYKIFVRFIKKAIHPIRDFTQTNERDLSPFIHKQNLKYFHEIKDLCLTLIDDCDTILAALESSSNLFFSVQGHKMNQVMKTLTIVATIFIPLTFVAGIYGMNFKYMPELEWQYGYFAVWAAMLLMLAGMFIYFKKKKWF
jgi:magnesium transporter